MGFRFPVKPKARTQLAAMANPEAANQPEALPWVLYDTQPWTTAVTASAQYFLTQQGDKTLGNMEGPGQLPDPQYFEIWYWGVDFLQAPEAAAAALSPAGPLNNIAQFLFVQRGIWTFAISNKNIGPFPLSFFHGSGGPTGFISIANPAAADAEYANNGLFDGGYCVADAIVIPPKLGFVVTLATFAAPVITQSPMNVRAWQAGVLHRRVL